MSSKLTALGFEKMPDVSHTWVTELVVQFPVAETELEQICRLSASLVNVGYSPVRIQSMLQNKYKELVDVEYNLALAIKNEELVTVDCPKCGEQIIYDGGPAFRGKFQVQCPDCGADWSMLFGVQEVQEGRGNHDDHDDYSVPMPPNKYSWLDSLLEYVGGPIEVELHRAIETLVLLHQHGHNIRLENTRLTELYRDMPGMEEIVDPLETEVRQRWNDHPAHAIELTGDNAWVSWQGQVWSIAGVTQQWHSEEWDLIHFEGKRPWRAGKALA